MKLIIASNNTGKIREYKQILQPLGYEIISQKEAGIHLEVEETGLTFVQNAALKAREIFVNTNCAVLADDSGLCVKALNDQPGVYSARYGGLLSHKERSQLILDKMHNVPWENRDAYFCCAICFIMKDGKEITAEGKVYGKIGFEPVGENGFGYDPIFVYNGKSFAEIEDHEKNLISHRKNALDDLVDKLKKGSYVL